MHALTLIFSVLLVAGTALRLWLSVRQQRAVHAERERVPEAFAAVITPDDHRKAADYAAARQRLHRVDTVVDAAWLAALTLAGGFGAIDGALRATGLQGIALGVVAIVATALLGGVVSLPLSVYGTFGIEARFGFNRTTPRLFVIDLIKGLVLGLAIGAPLVALVLWLFARAGSAWWLWAWAAWATFSLTLTWAWPRLIAPIFNKFRPLEPGEMRSRIEALVHRCGFESRGVFVMDGSRRSTHGNAYFAGLGNAKRIVFFDTLLERLVPEEVEAVLAHELGHFRLRHVAFRLAASLALALTGFALLGWLAREPAFYAAFGVTEPSAHAALMLFVLVVPVFTLPLAPLGAWWSRRHEYEADAYASQHASGERLADALVKLYRDNATSLTSDRLYSAFHDSHPPAPQRIAALRGA